MADAVAAEGLDNLKAFHIEDQKWRKLQLESVLHRKRVFVPKVDPQNPFRAETQLMDQYELRELNRNPRLYIQSQDRAQSLRRVYRPRGHSTTSPRGYVDHLPASASSEFKATLRRAVPREVLNPLLKKKHNARAQLLRDVRQPIVEESPSSGSRRSSIGGRSRAASVARSRAASVARSRAASVARSRAPSAARKGSVAPPDDLRSRLSKSATAPAGLPKPKGINDMTPSAPSFGHRPQSASRHFDALSMRANRLDRAPVGRLRVADDDPSKQLNAKYGVGLLKSTDLARMLSGEAAGAAHYVPGAGIADLAGKTAARLLWKTSHAAAHPPDPTADKHSPKKQKKKRRRKKRGVITASMMDGGLNTESSLDTVAREKAAAVLAAKAARARAFRGVVAAPTVGVGSGFGVMPEVVVPRFQVTSAGALEGGLLSDTYALHVRTTTAVKAGDEVRKQRRYRRQRPRDAEMLEHLETLRDEPLTMLDSTATPYYGSGTLGEDEFTPSDVPASRAQDVASIFSDRSGDDDGYGPNDGASQRFALDTRGSMFTDGERPQASPPPAQYDAETDTWCSPGGGDANHSGGSSMFGSTARSNTSGSQPPRRRRRGGKKARRARQRQALVKEHIIKEAGWDDSPHYMKSAAVERMEAFKKRAQERGEYRGVTESMEYYARRAAGAVEMDQMFCADKYVQDKKDANDDLMRLEQAPAGVAHTRTYLAHSPAKAITPRDQADDTRFTVDGALRAERHETQRRRSISRTNDRRASVGLPPIPSGRASVTPGMVHTGRSSGQPSARSARSGGYGADPYASVGPVDVPADTSMFAESSPEPQPGRFDDDAGAGGALAAHERGDDVGSANGEGDSEGDGYGSGGEATPEGGSHRPPHLHPRRAALMQYETDTIPGSPMPTPVGDAPTPEPFDDVVLSQVTHGVDEAVGDGVVDSSEPSAIAPQSSGELASQDGQVTTADDAAAAEESDRQ